MMSKMSKIPFPIQEVKLFFRTREKLTNFQFSPIGERELSPSSFSSSSFSSSPAITSPVKPLYWSPNQLSYLRFGHASSTTLRKLLYIKSSHNPTRCVIWIRSKQRHKPFLHLQAKFPTNSNESTRISPFPTSKRLTKLLLTFLDEATHWCWIGTIDDKSTAVNRGNFERLSNQRLLIHLVERQSWTAKPNP